jgi:hypothetical protein
MRSLPTLIRTTRAFIYPQYRVLLGNTNFLKLMSFLYLQRDFLCSSHNSYFLLLGSVYIPTVLCHVIVSCLLLGSVHIPTVLCHVIVSCLLLGSVHIPTVLCHVLVSCLLLGSVHIPTVLCHVIVSTCSSILNVYLASCFFIKMYICK